MLPSYSFLVIVSSSVFRYIERTTPKTNEYQQWSSISIPSGELYTESGGVEVGDVGGVYLLHQTLKRCNPCHTDHKVFCCHRPTLIVSPDDQ